MSASPVIIVIDMIDTQEHNITELILCLLVLLAY